MSHRLIPTEDELAAMNGGKAVIRGGERVMWFGSTPSKAEHSAAFDPFDPAEKLIRTDDRVLLTDYPKMANGGKHPAYNWQVTGSCVNGGFNNASIVRVGIDACVSVDPTPFVLPFTLAAYGLSRKMAFGDDSEGEGSSGDAIMRAAELQGTCETDNPRLVGVLPVPKVYDIAHCYTEQEELHWSRASACPQSVKDESAPHTVKYVVVKTIDQVEAEIRKLRPVTVAGNWGSVMGAMQYKGTGPNRVLLGQHTSSWEHQQSVLGVWRHPDLGRLWYIMNQWYYLNGLTCLPVHGRAANDEPDGGYWVTDEMISHQLAYRFGELRSLKSLKAYDQGKIGHMGV